MSELKPCPFCGEKLVEHEDHHGKWWAHKNEVGPCIDSVVQIHDQKDADAWNTRATDHAPDAAAIIHDFCEQVERAAEANMLKTGKLEGAHYAAMRKLRDGYKYAPPAFDPAAALVGLIQYCNNHNLVLHLRSTDGTREFACFESHDTEGCSIYEMVKRQDGRYVEDFPIWETEDATAAIAWLEGKE